MNNQHIVRKIDRLSITYGIHIHKASRYQIWAERIMGNDDNNYLLYSLYAGWSGELY